MMVRLPTIHMLVPGVVGILLVVGLRHILRVPPVVVVGVDSAAYRQAGQSDHGVANPERGGIGRDVGHAIGRIQIDAVVVGVMNGSTEVVRESGRRQQKYSRA